MNNNIHVVFGTGPLGMSVMQSLIDKGYRVRMVNRTGKANVPKGIDVVQSDVLKGINVNESTADASVVYQCVNPPYDKWPEQFPTMQNKILEAAAKAGAKLIIGENLYMYGDTNGVPMTENTAYAAETRKGKVRAQMSLDALQAHRDGKVRVSIGRASDYFGPGVFASAMGERVLLPALNSSTASLLGNIDVPHSFSYITDVGKGLVTLAENENALGEAWHIPNSDAISQRAFAELIFAEIGAPVKIKSAGRMMLRFGGLFVPAAKELVEMMYEFEKPFIVNSDKFEKAFGMKATPINDAIRTTIEWYKNFKTSG